MRIVRVVIKTQQPTYLRDPYYSGGFICGVECNAWGVSVRQEGCTEEPELRIRQDRVESSQVLG